MRSRVCAASEAGVRTCQIRCHLAEILGITFSPYRTQSDPYVNRHESPSRSGQSPEAMCRQLAGMHHASESQL